MHIKSKTTTTTTTTTTNNIITIINDNLNNNNNHMKFFHLSLIVSALVPLAAAAAAGNGQPKRPHGPHRRVPPHHPKRKPSRRFLKGGSNQNRQSVNVTATARFDCDTPNPLTLLESGCPCFDQDRIDSLIDFSTAEYCQFYQYGETLPEDHQCYQYVHGYQDTYLSGSTPEQTIQGDPPMFESSSADFSLTMSTDPEWGGSYCYASVSSFKSSTSWQDYDSSGQVTNDFGDSHSYYVSASLTNAEYEACKGVLDAQKAKLPENCYIENDDDWL